MHIHVLGSAAGGGFPQWNCNCYQCAALRKGELNAKPRSQSSITLSADGKHWVLLNVSPDIRSQIANFKALQPARKLRDTGIVGIVLSDAQIDHSSGLLTLREGEELNVYCTAPVYEDLTSGLPLFNLLEHYCGVSHHLIDVAHQQPFTIEKAIGLTFTAIPLISKAPPYSPHRNDPKPGDNIGLWIADENTQKSLFYAPGIGVMEEHLLPYMQNADCLLVDGSFWREDEMIACGVGNKYAKDMGHLPQGSEQGMLSVLKNFTKPRKILIHINNTNPILHEDSDERSQLQQAGIEVAYDGMDIIL